MPSTSEAHRTSIGLFHPTLLHILERKAKAKTDGAGLHTKKRRHKTANAKCELLSWLVCVSLSVVYFLSLLSLFLSILSLTDQMYGFREEPGAE